MSSWHIEGSGRGFSFLRDEVLIMRFDKGDGLTAYEIVNYWPQMEIEKVLREFGEERFARSISQNIVKARGQEKIKSAFELVRVIEDSVPGWYKRQKIHFATKTFQALRITANRELENLQTVLEQIPTMVKRNSRVVIISFHSLEDRIVKNIFRQWAKDEKGVILTKKPIVSGQKELGVNPRARSAKLRSFKFTV